MTESSATIAADVRAAVAWVHDPALERAISAVLAYAATGVERPSEEHMALSRRAAWVLAPDSPLVGALARAQARVALESGLAVSRATLATIAGCSYARVRAAVDAGHITEMIGYRHMIPVDEARRWLERADAGRTA